MSADSIVSQASDIRVRAIERDRNRLADDLRQLDRLQEEANGLDKSSGKSRAFQEILSARRTVEAFQEFNRRNTQSLNRYKQEMREAEAIGGAGGSGGCFGSVSMASVGLVTAVALAARLVRRMN